ncbi:MAG TPA: sorbosone dehydrogenase family protein [Blastocatellia bacterium]|nr:sorbosone dehydrogenase family protein [Blastocatellia bacterium]
MKIKRSALSPFMPLAAGLFIMVFSQTRNPMEFSAPPGSGKRIFLTSNGLPKPFDTESVRKPPTVIAQPSGARLELPPGFELSVFSEGDYRNPRWIKEGPNGDLFLADTQGDSIYLLRDTNKDGKIDNATERFTFATGLNRPFGMAVQKIGAQAWFYVGNTGSVVRFKYTPGQTKVEGAPEKLLEVPVGGHGTRDVLFSRDGKKMYVSVGSLSNVNEGEDPVRAAINEYNPDGSGHRIFASGIRNPVGLAWNPANGQLWTAVNERDLLGDDLVPEYATSVKDGGFYGWPDSYMGQNLDPRVKNPRKELVARAIVPDVLIEPHSAALGIVFYTGKMFPKEYQGDAFVALHGSWNRSKRSGYKVIRIPFTNGKPEGGYENFLMGWVPDETGDGVWGRPVGVTMIRDGSLLVVDDGGKKVWRVTHSGKK